MTHSPEEINTDPDLDWIQLRQELDDLRAKDRKSDSYKHNPFVVGGLVVTTIAYFYGLYNMNHPIKSTLGAYARISSQGLTAAIMAYWFLTSTKNKTRKIDLEYHD